jgi:protoporphyrinogen/coproporphyrinogen III oxidase
MTKPVQTERNAIVVGSGIAGMTAAFRLQQAGFSVRVLEAETIIGGRMTCRRINGYTLNRASTLLAGQYKFLTSLIAEVGLADRIKYSDFKIGTFRDGRIHSLRTNHMIRDSLFSGLLSWRSKLLMLRVVRDAAKAKPYLDFADLSVAAPLDVESARDYALRRLNKELLDYVVDPGIAALLATTADRPSVVDFLFTIAHYIGMGAYRYEGGIDFLIAELARRVPVTTSARVVSVVEDVNSIKSGVEVSWEQDGAAHVERVAACVIAVSAHTVPKLYPQLTDIQRDILNGYEYSTIMVGHLGLTSPPDIDADFLQIPSCENPALVNMYFPHKISTTVAPPGKSMAVGYFSTTWSAARMAHSDEQIVAEMIPHFEQIVPGISRTVEMTNVERWSPALFLSKPGSYQAMAAFQKEINPAARVQLAGDYFSFTSTNASAASGHIAARRLVESIGTLQQR